MKRVRLGKSRKYVLVDDSDFSLVSSKKWYLDSGGYAITADCIRMHRLLFNLDKGSGKYVDHINGNRTDNRRSNLRICDSRQNTYNNSLRKDNKSGYKGVIYITNKTGRKKRWVARVNALESGKIRKLAVYCLTKEEAALTYNKLATKYYGEFAKLNIL